MKKVFAAVIACGLALLLLCACSDPAVETEAPSETLQQPTASIPMPTNTTASVPGFAVTFYSDEGTILKIDRVAEGGTAIPPVEPQMSYGNIFMHWQEDYSDVHEDREIHPVCQSILGRTNVFALTGAAGRTGEDAFVSLMLCGDVEVSGFDLTVCYDPEILQLQNVYNEDGGVVYNEETPGQILINYVSTGNTLADVDICSLKFRVLGSPCETPVSIRMNSICANVTDEEEALYTPEYEILDSVIRIDQ